VGESVLIALLLLLLLALPAELLSTTIRENHNAIRRFLRLEGRPAGAVSRTLSHGPQRLTLAAFVVAGSVLYALLDPGFGFNLTTVAEVIGSSAASWWSRLRTTWRGARTSGGSSARAAG